MKTVAPSPASRSVTAECMQVAAADGETQVQQHLGDAAHADAADGHQMDVPGIAEQGSYPLVHSGRSSAGRTRSRPAATDPRR